VIAKLRAILAYEKEIYKIIVDELKEIKKNYGDERRTQIVNRAEEISIEDLIVDEDMAVTISHEGYIKRNAVTLYRAQRRGGKGKIGTTTREEDFVEYLFIASMHSYILFFTSFGKVYLIKVHELPQASRASETTRSPSSTSIRCTPWVLRPMTRMSVMRSLMILPLLVTSIS